MKPITKDTIIGWYSRGRSIESSSHADRLDKWAYDQLAIAPELLEACKGALAALSQNKNFPADIEAAKSFLKNAIYKAEGK